MFDFKQQASTLGDIIFQFADLSKRLNIAMVGNDALKTHVGTIIGNGRFNRAALNVEPGINPEEVTVLYGDALKEARHQSTVKYGGLMAVIPAIHHPLLGIAQTLLVDLGKQGYKCEVEIDGQIHSIPLDRLKIDFNDASQVFISSPTKTDTGTVPAGTVLLNCVPAEPIEHGIPVFPDCLITDGNNQYLHDSLVANLLWIAVTGMGKNIYGTAGTPKNQVLADKGVDDMYAANQKLIETVRALQHAHHYDAEPLWNRAFESARQQLEPHLGALAITRATIASGVESDNIPAIMKGEKTVYSVDVIDNIARFFNTPLPALDAPQRNLAGTIAAGLTA